MIPVFYRDEQSATSNSSFSPSAGKPALVMQDWLSNPDIAPHIEVHSFEPATLPQLYAAHSKRYVDGVLAGKFENGFGNKSLEVANSLRYTTGSLIAATEHVLRAGRELPLQCAVSPTSGFHHAGWNWGGGFCTFNGLMVAAINAYQKGLAKRILILDMDQHYGNGTDDILKHHKINYVDHVTAVKSYGTPDEALRVSFEAIMKKPYEHYDLVIYQAGADIHVDDPLGGLLTTREMRLRDMHVFSACCMKNTPVVFTLAGGYAKGPDGSLEPVLALHRQTIIECLTTGAN